MARARTARTPPRPLDWNEVQTFVATAESGSIAGAARRLGVNHSTVLRRLAALESQLATRLFDRLPSGYALTAAGNGLAEHLAGLSEQLDAAQRRALGLDPAVRGPVRVSSSDVVVEALLMPALARLRQRHPQVQVQLVMQPAFTALGRREADLAVLGADAAPAGLLARRVGHVETVLCASRRYLDAAGLRPGLLEPRDLRGQRWVGLDESYGFGAFDAWFERHVEPQRVVVRVDSLVGAADAVAAGLGVGALPRPLVASRPALVQLGDAVPGLDQPVWVLMHPDLERTARARALFEHLVRSLEGDARLGH